MREPHRLSVLPIHFAQARVDEVPTRVPLVQEVEVKGVSLYWAALVQAQEPPSRVG